MLPALIALGVGALIVMACWDDIVDWLRSFVRKVKNVLRKIGHAAKIFAKRLSNGLFRILHIVYYKENDKWYKEATPVEVEESEVPQWAKDGVASYETEVTDRYKNTLSLEM